MKNVIFGAGPLGQWVAELLIEQNQQAVIVNRSGKLPEYVNHAIESAACDANDPNQVAEVCKDAEVVFHCAMPPYTEWPQKFPALMNGIVEGVSHTKAKLVFGDNLYMYGPTGGQPIHEDLPHAATGHKGRIRAQMAEMLLEAHDKGQIKATIGRASDFFGPRVINAGFGEMFFAPALAGKTVNMVGDIDLPHTLSYIKDYAAGLILLSQEEKALGKAWHITHQETLTIRQVANRFADALGTKIKLRAAGKGMITFLGYFNPMIREVKEMMYSFEEPYIVDHSRFLKEFKMQATPWPQAIEETVAWYKYRK